jgi:aspartate aminotransferase-like enzyme
MFRKTRLFTPGPTPLLPAAQFAMAAADLHHRTPEFRALFLKVLAQLKTFIGTKNDVIVLACSGTGAMEAAVTNLTSPGDKVLVLSAGKFGERWVALAKTFGCEAVVLTKPYGQTFPLDEVKALLTPDVKAVFVQATETSTGVRHDVAGLAHLVKGTDALLVVDAITGLGTTTFDVDGDGIDVIIGGSQKALMIPPGLAYLAASEKAWARMETSKQARYYFDLRKERKNAAKGESAYTPSVALIAAMGAALDYLEQQGEGDLAKGRDLLIANAELCAMATRKAAKALGLELFAASPSAAATALKAPEGVSSTDIVKGFKKEFAGVLSDGQGEMKGQIVRIAHIGYLDYLDCVAILAGLEQVVAQLKPGSFAYGDAVRIAQQVYADARTAGAAKASAAQVGAAK